MQGKRGRDIYHLINDFPMVSKSLTRDMSLVYSQHTVDYKSSLNGTFTQKLIALEKYFLNKFVASA